MTTPNKSRPVQGGGEANDQHGEQYNGGGVDSSLTERALIGAILQEHDRIFPVVQTAGITAASFTDTICRRAWDAMAALREGRKIVDLVTVSENYGGDAGTAMLELGAIVNLCPTTAHAFHYAQEVRQAERRRGLHTAARMAMEQLDKGGAVDVVASQLKDATEVAGGGMEQILSTDAADYLENDPPPHDPVLDGVFELGDKVELIGGSKRRKSFAAIELAVHVATGRDWLGLHIPSRRRVVFFNLELRDRWIHRRIRRACRAHGIDPADLRGWLFLVNARGRGATVRARLVELARRDRAELVIVDPRYKLHLPGEAENAGEGIAGILDLFDRVAESGPAVLVVHHDPKGDAGDRAIADRGGGSSWAGRDVDARLTLTPQKTDPEGASVVSVMVRNFPPVPDFCIRWEDDRFRLDADLMPLPFTSWDRRKALNGGGAGRTAESFEAVALEAAREPLNRNDLLSKIQAAGASRDLARACVEGLVSRGDLAHTPRQGAKNGAVKYGLPAVLKNYMNPRFAV